MAEEPRDRRARALELHLAGASYQAIADALGYASRGSAHDAVQKALEDLAPDASQFEATAIARIDAMLQGLWPKARRGDVQAIDRVLRLEQERRALKNESAETTPQEVPSGGSKLGRLRAVHAESA